MLRGGAPGQGRRLLYGTASSTGLGLAGMASFAGPGGGLGALGELAKFRGSLAP